MSKRNPRRNPKTQRARDAARYGLIVGPVITDERDAAVGGFVAKPQRQNLDEAEQMQRAMLFRLAGRGVARLGRTVLAIWAYESAGDDGTCAITAKLATGDPLFGIIETAKMTEENLEKIIDEFEWYYHNTGNELRRMSPSHSGPIRLVGLDASMGESVPL